MGRYLCSDLSWQALSPEGSSTDDFLDVLLGESDCSSATASPLWSPCTTDSGINEDLPADQTESLPPLSCTSYPAFNTRSFHLPPPLQYQPPPSEKTPYVSIDLGKTWFTIKRTIMMKKNGPFSSYECLNSELKCHIMAHRNSRWASATEGIKHGLLCHNDLFVRPVAE